MHVRPILGLLSGSQVNPLPGMSTPQVFLTVSCQLGAKAGAQRCETSGSRGGALDGFSPRMHTH